MNTNMPWAPSAWKHWVDHIIRQGHKFGLKRATLVHANGTTASASSGFVLPSHEIKKFADYFDGVVKDDPERISLQGKTYVIKSTSASQIIAFNGSRYFVISRAKTMYIVVMCDSRTMYEDGARWLKRLTDSLVAKGY
ncbi:hypothetical protein LSAT2_029388 [Lamellibrachia satsuma]|nr:hypothetical protein LSAT2_029388 [Lamellibrachia satsuma]